MTLGPHMGAFILMSILVILSFFFVYYIDDRNKYIIKIKF